MKAREIFTRFKNWLRQHNILDALSQVLGNLLMLAIGVSAHRLWVMDEHALAIALGLIALMYFILDAIIGWE
jgi:hypothetical protein